MTKTDYKSIDEYIATFPVDTQAVLQKIRQTIHKAAPKAEEAISYQIPTFKLNGKYLIYFAGYEHHVSVYPQAHGDEAFMEQQAKYASGKGTLKFPLDQPIPYDFIAQVTQARLAERLEY